MPWPSENVLRLLEEGQAVEEMAHGCLLGVRPGLGASAASGAALDVVQQAAGRV
jgi:hypothetical protein